MHQLRLTARRCHCLAQRRLSGHLTGVTCASWTVCCGTPAASVSVSPQTNRKEDRMVRVALCSAPRAVTSDGTVPLIVDQPAMVDLSPHAEEA